MRSGPAARAVRRRRELARHGFASWPPTKACSIPSAHRRRAVGARRSAGGALEFYSVGREVEDEHAARGVAILEKSGASDEEQMRGRHALRRPPTARALL